MKRVYKNWLVRMTIGFAALTSLRLVATVLHMTTLERLYKPRDFRKTSHQTIGPEIIEGLPKYANTVWGQKMDPINLLFIGSQSGIKHAFEKAGWSSAHPSTPLHIIAGLIFSITRRSYRQGPFMPLFTGIGMQDFSFQKTTYRNRFAERHHIRIWRTKHMLPGNKRLWVAAASFEVGFKVVALPPFLVHRMNPNLDMERDLIVGELIDQGHLLAQEQTLNPPSSADKPRHNPHHDAYFTDGKAQVIEII